MERYVGHCFLPACHKYGKNTCRRRLHGNENAMPAGRRIRESENVRIFQAVFKRVFSWRKICLRYFKIGQTYFEICALYFFFAPMWGERAENQFSFFLA